VFPIENKGSLKGLYYFNVFPSSEILPGQKKLPEGKSIYDNFMRSE
jgi:hypothetical protein